ncbi:MAG: polysaccharide biosynthesis/export family protein [Flavobacteriales bacterium]|nr:polysaccharide biosynthesis/export family protein [Flavobacteriales bacterium]
MKNYSIVNTKSAIYILLFLFTFSSCITNRDLEYIRSNKEITKAKANKQDYRLQQGDLISVQISTTTQQQHDFFNKENTSNSQLMIQNPYLYGYIINEEGNLDLPSFGKVKAAGFTLRELENVIKNIAVSYFESPVIKLNIINFEITILGEVNNPGTFKIVDPEVNILYALSLSGDMTQFGNRRKVKVIRNENELNRVFYVDLTKKGVLNNSDFMLQPHDIIYVAPLNKKFYAFNNITNVVSMALSAVTLYLLINKN